MVCAVTVWDDDRPLRDSSGFTGRHAGSPASPPARLHLSMPARFHLIYAHTHLFMDTVFFPSQISLFHRSVQTHISMFFCQDFVLFGHRITGNSACMFWCMDSKRSQFYHWNEIRFIIEWTMFTKFTTVYLNNYCFITIITDYNA